MSIQPAICKRAALLTCVTNAGGIGPGHTAIAIDGHVFSFERFLAGWVSMGTSGWVRFRTRDYLEKNKHRPVVIQELDPGRTNATAIHDYIARSDAADADYFSSGVCSQQAARALSAGLGFTVNPPLMNTPLKVYWTVKKSDRVLISYYTFPDRNEYSPINGRKVWLSNVYSPECDAHISHPFILSW